MVTPSTAGTAEQAFVSLHTKIKCHYFMACCISLEHGYCLSSATAILREINCSISGIYRPAHTHSSTCMHRHHRHLSPLAYHEEKQLAKVNGVKIFSKSKALAQILHTSATSKAIIILPSNTVCVLTTLLSCQDPHGIASPVSGLGEEERRAEMFRAVREVNSTARTRSQWC